MSHQVDLQAPQVQFLKGMSLFQSYNMKQGLKTCKEYPVHRRKSACQKNGNKENKPMGVYAGEELLPEYTMSCLVDDHQLNKVQLGRCLI